MTTRTLRKGKEIHPADEKRFFIGQIERTVRMRFRWKKGQRYRVKLKPIVDKLTSQRFEAFLTGPYRQFARELPNACVTYYPRLR